MMSLGEYRNRAALLSDFLPWAALVEKGVVLNKDGSFQRTAKIRGPDLDSATPAELVGVTGRLNNALRRLGSGWAVFVEAQRVPATVYPESDFPDAASQMVDLERREQFEDEGAHFESRYFLTLVWLPPAESSGRAERFLYEGREHDGPDPHGMLHAFVDRTDRMLALLDGFMPEAAWLNDGETLTYLHSTISTRNQRVRVPEIPMHLDALLVDQPLSGGLEPKLGDAYLKTLTITGFPSRTFPGILDDLNRLAMPYRWSTRAILLDKTDATKVLTKIRRQWFAKRKSIAAIIREVMTNEASVLVDNDAANKAADADLALQSLGADDVGQAYLTATVTVWDGSASIAAEKLRLVEKIIQGRDFTCMTESLNAVEAWLGSLPGHVYANVRQPPVSTLNLAHMIPLSAVWAGSERDVHFKAPPLFYGKTAGATPFRFSLHVGDVGHTLIAGPTGAGKSVLLALMALQFRRYAGSQIFAFDFGGSMRAATLAMGGDWHDLGGGLTDEDAAGEQGSGVSLQPLLRIDDPDERKWASEWLGQILVGEGVALTPDVKAHLWSALNSLASSPSHERTILGLVALLQSNALKQALAPYCLGGPYGRLLDADAERLGDADVVVFETEGLIGSGAASSVLSYLFHRIEGRLDGRPTLLVIDEGWLVLDDGDFAGQLREWLKTLRKKNASVIFATQSLSDIANSPIAPAVVESCPTRILLPNERAIEPQIATIYRDFGLNDRQIAIIARAASKREYYCQTQRGNRLFELGLGPVALALCATSGKDDHRLIDSVLAEHGLDGFLPAWFEARGVTWAADLLREGGRAVRYRLIPAVMVIAFTVSSSPPAHAQWAVYDGANHVENVLIAARSLQQIDNQITSLANQAQMLVNQGRNLASLPLSTLSTLQSTISQTTALLAQAQNIAYSVQSVEQQYQQAYTSVSSGMSDSALFGQAQTRWQNSVGGFEDALKLQARVVGNIPTDSSAMTQLVSASQTSTGALQAAQAGNQLLALQSHQLSDIQAELAANGRATVLQQARDAATEAESDAQYQHFSQHDVYVPGTVSMFGSSGN